MKAELAELLDDDVCVLFNDPLSFDDDPQTNSPFVSMNQGSTSHWMKGTENLHSAMHGAQIEDIDETPAMDARQDKSMDATRVYLNELARSQLLTAEQEKIYGARALLVMQQPAKS